MKQTFYEDIEPGAQLRSPWYRVTREAIVEFAQAWDPIPIHTDEQVAKEGMFGELIACTAHIFAIQSLLAQHLEEDLAFLAGLGGDGMTLLLPVVADDELRLVRTYTEKRVSRSKPDRGIVRIDHTLERRNGEQVFRTTGSILVRRRG